MALYSLSLGLGGFPLFRMEPPSDTPMMRDGRTANG